MAKLRFSDGILCPLRLGGRGEKQIRNESKIIRLPYVNWEAYSYENRHLTPVLQRHANDSPVAEAFWIVTAPFSVVRGAGRKAREFGQENTFVSWHRQLTGQHGP